LHTRKVQKSVSFDMPKDLQMLLLDVDFWRCLCND